MPLFDPRRIAPDGTWRARAIHFAAAIIPRKITMPILQGPLRGAKWIVDAASHACWLGTYETDTTAVMSEAIRTGNVVFDLGAHAGYHSLHASKLVGPNGQVWSFEPNPANARFLRKHIDLNRAGNVHVMECAVSDANGECAFDDGMNCFSGHLSNNGSRKVRTISIDSAVAAGQLPVPDYLKIDVEGAEFKVLSGAIETLRRRRPFVLLETHEWIPGFEPVREECSRLLAALDYDVETTQNCFHLYARPRSRS
jgi:FkbM family methyltransferase